MRLDGGAVWDDKKEKVSPMRRNAIGLVVAFALALGACSPTGAASSPPAAAESAAAGASASAAAVASSEPAGKPHLLVWTDANRKPGFEEYAALVKDKVDIKIELVDDTTILGKIQLFNQTGSGWPDAMFLGAPFQLALLQSKAFDYTLELTPELVGQDFLDGFGNANSWCVIDGKTWCLKNDLAQSVLWYDTVLFKQLGLTVPTTMDEFATEAMKLKGTGYVAGAIGDYNFFASYLWPSGCPVPEVISSTDLRINSTDPKCTRVANLIQPLVDAKVLDTRSSFDAGFLADVAQKGKVVMTLGPAWFGRSVIKPDDSWAVPAGRYTAAPMPKWDGESVAYSGEWGGGIYIASKHAEFPQAAADMLKWLVSDPAHVKESKNFPAYGPANKIWTQVLAADPYYAQDPGPAMTVQSQLINPSLAPFRVDADSVINSTLVVKIGEGASIQEAIDALAEGLNNLAPSGGYTISK